MRYRLLCIDLDGTLLMDDKMVNKQDGEALRRASSQGVEIALVTNRMPAAVEPIVKMLGIPCILACNAGTYILEEGRCLHAEYIPVESMWNVYESIKALEASLWIYRNEEWLVTAKNRFVEAEEKVIQYSSMPVSVEKLLAKWEWEGKGPNELLIVEESKLVQEAYGKLKDRKDMDITRSSPDCLEMLPKGINKGTALMTLCEKKGIKREETIAFGDHRLDIPLLEAAGIAVAYALSRILHPRLHQAVGGISPKPPAEHENGNR